MASAAFTIQGGSSPQSVAALATVSLALTSTSGVNTILWEIVGTTHAAVTTPTITVGGSPAGATATLTMPTPSVAAEGYAVLVRCTINAGRDAAGVNAAYVASGIVGVTSSKGFLPLVPGETLERDAVRGVAPNINTMLNSSVLLVGAGTAAAPSYSFVGDTNTGIYSPAADSIGLATGGAIRVAIATNIWSYLTSFIFDPGLSLIEIYQFQKSGGTGAPASFRAQDVVTSGTVNVGGSMTVQAGAASGGSTSNTGGGLILASGVGSGTGAANGTVTLQRGSTAVVTVEADGANSKLKLQSNMRLDYAISQTLGGGATATLGTIGGSGPAAAAQSKWIEVLVAGTKHFIPAWV